MSSNPEASICLFSSVEDQSFADDLERVLSSFGIRVWRAERDSKAGRTIFHEQERKLEDAECIIILWSNKSAQSDTLREIAGKARDRHALIPVLIEQNVLEPRESYGLPTENLSDWNRRTNDHSGIRRLRKKIDELKSNNQIKPQNSNYNNLIKQLKPEHWISIIGLIITAILGITSNEWIRCSLGVDKSSCIKNKGSSSKPTITSTPKHTSGKVQPDVTLSSNTSTTPTPTPRFTTTPIQPDVTLSSNTSIEPIQSSFCSRSFNFVQSQTTPFSGRYNNDGQPLYIFEIWMTETEDVRQQVNYVQYQLHPTFDQPFQIRNDPSDGFKLSGYAWDGFRIPITINCKDNTSRQQLIDLIITR
ncbi:MULTISPECIES: pYEATS domain-containing protein [Nostoc]|uniref:TIR domain-containing protein n=1 Tax=Nostoc paludosum FACHB-159 TaxID=2692908 RepID=A0ABR8KIS2_9NOSO|nr:MULTISPECIES: pYEATS domain-containing protein [Nostoc]MBD2682328.1 TIR domain-containing protein [Nostoc sp. FACHB-857]MBD2738661.1 TIR domain-containing protein [Nostoc paludosum FACHB-159]